MQDFIIWKLNDPPHQSRNPFSINKKVHWSFMRSTSYRTHTKKYLSKETTASSIFRDEIAKIARPSCRRRPSFLCQQEIISILSSVCHTLD